MIGDRKWTFDPSSTWGRGSSNNIYIFFLEKKIRFRIDVTLHLLLRVFLFLFFSLSFFFLEGSFGYLYLPKHTDVCTNGARVGKKLLKLGLIVKQKNKSRRRQRKKKQWSIRRYIEIPPQWISKILFTIIQFVFFSTRYYLIKITSLIGIIALLYYYIEEIITTEWMATWLIEKYIYHFIFIVLSC